MKWAFLSKKGFPLYLIWQDKNELGMLDDFII
jgi:hypothetical protein